MDVLNHYQVGRILERLGLSAKDQKAFELILPLLNESNKATIAAIHEALYPFSNTSSANGSLKNLCKRFNAAAEAQGIDITVLRSTEKKGGAAARQLWFKGPTPPPDAALTPELDRVRHHTEITDTKGVIPSERDVIVLVTCNAHETKAVRERFCGEHPPKQIIRNGLDYHWLGTVGGMDIVQRVSQQGTHAAHKAAAAAWQAWTPVAIIGVGIAFGVRETSQRIGDVLVATSVIDYQLGKVKDGTLELRAPGAPTSYHIRNRFWSWHQYLDDPQQLPEVLFGNMLSGDKLIDDVDYRNYLKKLANRDVIGGEMEGLGIHHALEGTSCEWIIVKAICDFADGNKGNSTKERDQWTAAQNAAEVVYAALTQGPIYADGGSDDHPPRCPPPSDSELIKIPSRVNDTKGESFSLSKSEPTPAASSRGTDVMDFLTSWINNPDSPPLCALLGEYGTGKTVSCQRFSERLYQEHTADPSAPLPIYFDLREIQNPGSRVPTLVETVQECLDRGWRADRSYSLDEFWAWVDQGAVVIFDGLDEVLVKLNEADGSAFTRGLLSLLDTAQQRQNDDPSRKLPKVLVSCRTQYFRTLNEQRNHLTGNERGNKQAESFAALQLLPFTREQIRRYLEGLAGSTDVDGTMELLDEVHNLADLASRPVTLKMISEQLEGLEAKRRSGQTIRGVDIYEGLTQRWLERDARKKGIKPEHKLSLMEHLAAYLWRHESTRLQAIEIEDWFHEWRETQRSFKRYNSMSPDLLEEDLRVATFLARRDEGKDSTFGFAHTSMHEYFLARHLLSAVRKDRPEGWAIRRPSEETLEFLGQLFDAEPDLIRTLNSWRTEYRPRTSELILHYGLHALRTDHPAPTLRDINLAGAQLEDLVVDGYHTSRPVDLSHADFTGASLGYTSFGRVDLSHALFDDADTRSLYLRESPAPTLSWSRIATQWASLYPAPTTNNTPSPRSLTWRTGHTDWVTAVAYHPQGDTLTTTSLDGAAIIWDTNTGELLHTLTGHTRGVTAVAYHPQGDTLTTTSFDGTAITWNTHTGEKLHTLTGHTNAVTAVAYHPNGDTLTTTSRDGTAITWNTHTGELLHTLTGHTNGVTAVAYHPQGDTLTTTSLDGTAITWNTHTGEQLHTLTGHTNAVTAVAYHPNGDTLTTTSRDGTAITWNTHTGEKLHTLTGHTSRVTAVAYHPQGDTLTTTSRDGTAITWNTHTGELLHTLTGHTNGVTAVAYHPQGDTLTTTSLDGTAITWNTHTGQPIHTFGEHSYGVTAVAYHPNGDTLTTTSTDGTATTWATRTGKPLWVVGFAKPEPFQLESYASWNPNTNEVISCVGEAWRCLQWECLDADGNVTLVPVAETEPARPL